MTSPVDLPLMDLLAQMDGQLISDGCDHCDAATEIVNKGRGMILMKISHDPWCPDFLAQPTLDKAAFPPARCPGCGSEVYRIAGTDPTCAMCESTPKTSE